jgi:lysozyme
MAETKVTATDLTVARLATEEGFRAKAYRDTKGKLTIGYGFSVDAGISQYCAHALLEAQAQELAIELGRFSWFVGLDDIRASVLIDLAFNDGLVGLLHFPKMIAGIGARNWQVAHDELLDSEAARELPTRYSALAKILLNGTE